MEFNKKYNRAELISFLKNKFLPEDFENETQEIAPKTQNQLICSVSKLGTCGSLGLVVYEIRHNSKNDARVGLTKAAFRFLADEWEDKALVAFVPADNDANYRFSLITIDLDENEKGKTVKSYSNPRRYSYFLGNGIAYYTPNKYLNEKGRVTDYEDLKSRFSVEVLTKAFYQELSDWYAWAVKEIRFPNKLEDPTDDDKFNAESTIRLVTRLIFVWFLKQKHLIPEEFFDEEYIRENLIHDFNPNTKVDMFWKSAESKYYKAILQNLFFAMLNSPITKEGSTEISERRFRDNRGDYDNNKLMRYESYFTNPQLFVDLANKTVPFLNGGLFDCLDDKDNNNYVDGFSDRELVKKSLIVPDYLFFGEEVGKSIDLSEWYGDKKKKKVSARGIIDILKRYNFTVEENTPFDQEVSLDPELLGKVFENLLASYNPETQTTARKQTGSFYTPREIVQYMVNESLVAHLKRIVGEELETEYRKLISYADEELCLNDEQKQKVIEAIYHCKVLDPACGSGAFPVGMLQQMVHILSQLDPTNEQWKKIMLDEAVNESRNAFLVDAKEEREERLKDIENSFDESMNHPDYARKLYLIENCIYGVDIQPIAIQISKLRFFISLVVDQKTNNDPVQNFGIRPLPNLEAKFVAANTLIPINKANDELGRTPEVIAIENKLKEANHKIFSARTRKTKKRWKERVIELRHELADRLVSDGFLTNDAANQVTSWDMFDQNASASFFDADWMFGVKDGFDVVIGNPPYINIQKLQYGFNEFKVYYSKIHTGYNDLMYYFFYKGICLLSSNGVLSLITSNYFIGNDYAKKLRLFLNDKIETIVNFHDAKVFESANVHTAISFSTPKSIKEKVSFYTFKKQQVKRMLLNDEYELCKINRKNLSDKWVIANIESSSIINKMKLNSIMLGEIVDIEQGSKSGKNKIFTITKDFALESMFEIDILRKNVKNSDIHRYYYTDRDNYLIYTDNSTNINIYPNIYNYLLINKNELSARNEVSKGLYPWYRFDRPRKKHIFDAKEKIIVPYRAAHNCFAYDNQQCFNDGGDIRVMVCKNDTKYKLKFLLGLLNSTLLDWYYAFIGKPKGNAREYFNEPLSQIPIINDIDEQELVISLVDNIINVKLRDYNADIKSYDKKIDIIVYQLYGLTYDEVLIVDSETTITEEEYNNFKN